MSLSLFCFVFLGSGQLQQSRTSGHLLPSAPSIRASWCLVAQVMLQVPRLAARAAVSRPQGPISRCPSETGLVVPAYEVPVVLLDMTVRGCFFLRAFSDPVRITSAGLKHVPSAFPRHGHSGPSSQFLGPACHCWA